MREIVEKVNKWFDDRKIIENTTWQKQIDKLLSEVAELVAACAIGDMDAIIDAHGDTQVVLIGLAKFFKLDNDRCLEFAFSEISERKGKMINGQFVKE